VSRTRTAFLNVDIDLKSIEDPTSFVQALGSKVLPQSLGKVGRAHWVRLELARQPRSPADAILGFAQLVAKLPPRDRAAWANAASRELDIGIRAGFEPASAEWVLEAGVVEAIVRLGARLRITVYSPEMRSRRSGRRPTKRTA
jgi:hypothetical protein